MTFRTPRPEVLLTLHGADAEPVVVVKTNCPRCIGRVERAKAKAGTDGRS